MSFTRINNCGYPQYPQGYPQNYNQNFVNQNMNNEQYVPQVTGMIIVRSIEEVNNYPVAPGNSVIFKNEVAPYIYVKTMGTSPLDRPIVEAFKSLKEQPQQEQVQINDYAKDFEALKGEIGALRGETEALKSEIEELKKGSAVNG